MKGTAFDGHFNTARYHTNLDDSDTDGFVERITDDNQFYIANKSLLNWYFVSETNGWRSNHTRMSTPNQMRILVTFPRAEMIRGCLTPMSVPAIFNKPTFSGSAFSPGIYEDYLVPWHVLIEGKADDKLKTKWELMDEITLEHFSARAHVYFSYPRRVKHIRLTIQDWYGISLMDDMRQDYVYARSDTPGRRYEEYSASDPYAYEIACRGSKDNIGTFLDNTAAYEHTELRREWRKWKERTIQSIWKGIYIPPFLFFGNNGS